MQARTAITEGGAAVAVATEYINVLPEEERLAEVTSNFWGTKFSILSSNPELMPPSLGEVGQSLSHSDKFIWRGSELMIGFNNDTYIFARWCTRRACCISSLDR